MKRIKPKLNPGWNDNIFHQNQRNTLLCHSSEVCENGSFITWILSIVWRVFHFGSWFCFHLQEIGCLYTDRYVLLLLFSKLLTVLRIKLRTLWIIKHVCTLVVNIQIQYAMDCNCGILLLDIFPKCHNTHWNILVTL